MNEDEDGPCNSRIFEIDLILDNITQYISQTDLIALQNVNRFLYNYVTPKIFVKLSNSEDFDQFYISNVFKAQNENFEYLYKCFDFTEWISESETTNYFKKLQIYDLQDKICQLQNLGPIQKLILPVIIGHEKYKRIFNIVSTTLKYLKIHFSVPKNRFGVLSEMHENLLLRKEDSNTNIFPLEELFHLEIQSNILLRKRHPTSESLLEHFKFIVQNIISGASSIKRLTLINAYSYILDILLDSKLKLEYLNISSVKAYESPYEKDILLRLILILNKFNLNYFSYKGIKFTKINFFKFFKILSIYEKWERYKEFIELISGEGQELQIESLEYYPEDWNYFEDIPGDKIFFHFPNLKNLRLNEYENKNDDWIDNVGLKEKFQNLQINFNTGLISSKVCEKFPNLTILKIYDSTQNGKINIVTIFENLIKLKELEIVSRKSPLKDSILTGIDNEFIRDALRGNSYNYLCNLPIHPGLKTQMGIANLKELQSFKMSIKKCNIGISLLFGFRFLPKLEILDISGQKNKPVPEDYWRIFLREYSNLKELKITQHNEYEDFPIFEQIKENLPKLKLEVIRVLSDIRNEALNDIDTSDEE